MVLRCGIVYTSSFVVKVCLCIQLRNEKSTLPIPFVAGQKGRDIVGQCMVSGLGSLGVLHIVIIKGSYLLFLSRWKIFKNILLGSLERECTCNSCC